MSLGKMLSREKLFFLCPHKRKEFNFFFLTTQRLLLAYLGTSPFRLALRKTLWKSRKVILHPETYFSYNYPFFVQFSASIRFSISSFLPISSIFRDDFWAYFSIFLSLFRLFGLVFFRVLVHVLKNSRQTWNEVKNPPQIRLLRIQLDLKMTCVLSTIR